ncbi:stage III sporulation protein AE [Clostridium sp. 'White wine YQ']|uniref:stage III sporulation protein AE n=1 Tax=Clostridium sp. 'White wine YQ' TaxID=3027474 RepID=UPI002366831C|nr:stage III sporulation protein AE [Clostridium sp. 'White wine YQ']MDD7793942.1 stage III sporulation protein AE [Clostridium sp. 'White wine YQ']
MKKIIKVLLVTIFINIFLVMTPMAKELDNNTSDLEQSSNVQELYDYVTKMKSESELMNELNVGNYIKTYITQGKGDLSTKELSKALLSAVFKEAKGVLQLLISIIVIAILCSLLRNLQDAFKGSHGDIAFYACYAILIIIISKSFLITIDLAKTTIQNLTDFMMALIPVLVFMIGSVGGITEAVTMDPILMGAVTIAPRVYVDFIIPMILMSFVLNFVNNLSNDHKITNICKLFKQITLWVQGILVTILIGLLTIRGITSTAIDAVTLKTAKFAVDNFIPIVGKAFSDAIASVAGYAVLLKNAISSLGLLVVIFIVLIPIIKLIMITVMYKLSAALVEPICDSRITNCIASVGDFVVMIISCMLSISLMFFVMIAIMASTGKFVVGG